MGMSESNCHITGLSASSWTCSARSIVYVISVSSCSCGWMSCTTSNHQLVSGDWWCIVSWLRHKVSGGVKNVPVNTQRALSALCSWLHFVFSFLSLFCNALWYKIQIKIIYLHSLECDSNGSLLLSIWLISLMDCQFQKLENNIRPYGS